MRLSIFNSIFICSFILSYMAADTAVSHYATGQVKSYTAFDDGHYKKGTIKQYQRDDSFEYVYDHTLNLFWQDDVQIFSNKKSLDDAKNYCENLNLNGLDLWRLPTLREFQSIIDRSKYNPALNDAFENSANDKYWSAYSPNSSTVSMLSNAGISPLSSLSAGQGFWVNIE